MGASTTLRNLLTQNRNRFGNLQNKYQAMYMSHISTLSLEIVIIFVVFTASCKFEQSQGI
jgi:hypothetical protein